MTRRRAKARKLAAQFYPGWGYRFYRPRYALGMNDPLADGLSQIARSAAKASQQIGPMWEQAFRVARSLRS